MSLLPRLQVVVVSDAFEGQSLVARHRMVNQLFTEEMKGAMHGENFLVLLGTARTPEP